MADLGILQVCSLLGALATGIAGPLAVVRWAGSYVSNEIEDAKKELRTETGAVAHKANNLATRVDAIERARTGDVERIVRLESNLSNLKDGQARIEHQLETMKQDEAKGRAEIIDSLRELRTVAPRG